MTEVTAPTRRVGYAGVSIYGNTLDAQLEQFRADGSRKIYREKANGAEAADRSELQRLLKAIAQAMRSRWRGSTGWPARPWSVSPS